VDIRVIRGKESFEKDKMELLYKEETYKIRKAIFEVYNSLGSVF